MDVSFGPINIDPSFAVLPIWDNGTWDTSFEMVDGQVGLDDRDMGLYFWR